MNKKEHTNQVSASGEPNDPSAATSRENVAPALGKEPASGELAAAPLFGAERSDRDSFNEQSNKSNQIRIRKLVANQVKSFRQRADSLEKRWSEIPNNLPDYIYEYFDRIG